MQLLPALLGLLIVLASPITAEPSATGSRVLVVLDSLDALPFYSTFFASLTDQGFTLKYAEATDPALRIEEHGLPLHDHIALFAPKAKAFGPDLLAAALVRFVSQGGSVLHVADSDLSEPQRDFAAQFGVEFDNRGSSLIDHAAHNTSSDHTVVLSSDLNLALPLAADITRDSAGAPTLFRGIPHTLVPGLLRAWPLLSAPATSYSWEESAPIDAPPTLSGRASSLVSLAQARNGARVAFAGSLLMFSDAYLASPTEQYHPTLSAHARAGNHALVSHLARWTLQARDVLRVLRTAHAPILPIGSAASPYSAPSDAYRIKDDVNYAIDLALFEEGAWRPYTTDQLQLELTMLDPHIRATLPEVAHLPSHSTYSLNLTLPDVYGVFTFRALLKRPALTEIDVKDIHPIRPFHHDEYPRGLSQAIPYYAGTISTIAAFLLFCVLWLWNKETAPIPTASPSPSPSPSSKKKSSRK